MNEASGYEVLSMELEYESLAVSDIGLVASTCATAGTVDGC